MITTKKEKTVRLGKRHGFIWNLVHYRTLFLFLLPGLVLLILKNYMPMTGIIMAFKNMDNSLGMFNSPFCGFKNFEFLLKSEDVWRATKNTLIYNSIFLALGVVLKVALAIGITELMNQKFAKIYQTFFCLPHFFSAVMVACIVNAFLSSSPDGVVNRILVSMGANSVSWYNTIWIWPFLLTFVHFWQGTGYGAIIYIATITGFDQEIFEAAVVDGANRWQRIRYMTIPMLKQTVVVLTILALGNLFEGGFGLFYQVTLDSPTLYPVTDVIDTYIYRSLTTMPDLGMTTAASFIQSTIGCILVVAVNLVVRRWDPNSSLF